MKVVLISGEYPVEGKAGGIASVVYHLCREFDKRKIDYKIVCTRDFEFKTNKGVFLNAWGKEPISYISFGLNFKKFLEKDKDNWDIFHFHLPNGLGPLLFSGSIKNKTLVTVHTTSNEYNKYLYKKCPSRYLSWKEKLIKLGYIQIPILLEKIALKGCKRVIAVSDGVKKELESEYGLENVKVIRKGIDTNKLCKPQHSKNDKLKVLYVGRLVGQKGVFLGIDALAKVKKDFEFLVVGKGTLEQKLKEHCKKKGINARFLGYVEDNLLYQLYARSDILLMPSFYETEPLVAMEGAGSGLPIVAFEGARIENIVGKENRKLIAKTGDVKALSESVDYLIDNEDIRRKIGKENRENVLKNYDSEKMAEAYIKTYIEVIGQ